MESETLTSKLKQYLAIGLVSLALGCTSIEPKEKTPAPIDIKAEPCFYLGIESSNPDYITQKAFKPTK